MDAVATTAIEPGRSFPLGASLVAGGANFSVFSKHASAVQLLLFDRADDVCPARVIDLDPHTQRTYHYWHAFVPGVEAGQLYGYRAHGAFVPEKGLRFDASKVLLDPYAKCVARPSRHEPSRCALAEGRRFDGFEERAGRSGRLRLGGRPSSPHPIHENRHL